MIISFFSLDLEVVRKNCPKIGISPKRGIFWIDLLSSEEIKPPIAMVIPGRICT